MVEIGEWPILPHFMKAYSTEAALRRSRALVGSSYHIDAWPLAVQLLVSSRR